MRKLRSSHISPRASNPSLFSISQESSLPREQDLQDPLPLQSQNDPKPNLPQKEHSSSSNDRKRFPNHSLLFFLLSRSYSRTMAIVLFFLCHHFSNSSLSLPKNLPLAAPFFPHLRAKKRTRLLRTKSFPGLY